MSNKSIIVPINYNFVINQYLELPSVQATIESLFKDDFVLLSTNSDMYTIFTLLGEVDDWSEYLRQYGVEYELKPGLTTKLPFLKGNKYPKRVNVYKPSYNEIISSLSRHYL
jgi:hypothetical protein